MPPPLLYGPYQTPRVRLGAIVPDEARDRDVRVVGLSDARIPWPLGRPPGSPATALIVFGALAEAVRRESNAAVCHFWGVTPQTVSRWRKALGVGPYTPGTTRLKSSSAAESEGIAAALKLAQAKARDPERRAKISRAKTGKPRPWQVIERCIEAATGKRASPETRAKMSAAHKARGTVPPAAVGKLWTPAEDEVLRTLPPWDAARRLGRPLGAVYSRRYRLGLPSARVPPPDRRPPATPPRPARPAPSGPGRAG